MRVPESAVVMGPQSRLWVCVCVCVKSGPSLHGPGLKSASAFTSISQIKACPGDKIMQSSRVCESAVCHVARDSFGCFLLTFLCSTIS